MIAGSQLRNAEVQVYNKFNRLFIKKEYNPCISA